MKEVINCPNCNASEKKVIYITKDRHYGIKDCFSISQCQICRLVFLNPMPSDEELLLFYPEESYYSYNIDLFRKEPSWKNAIKRILFLNHQTKDPQFLKPGEILDIGCGNGWIIYQMREAGWKVKGVEPSKTGAETGRKLADLDIFNGDLLSAAFPSDSFDYVRANHSFEHIPNPNEVLEEIKRVLRPGGKGFIGVPNFNSWSRKVFGKYWYYLGVPVHTFNYSDTTLPQMLEKHGFKNIVVSYNSDYSGFLGSFQIFLNRNNGKTSFDGFFINFLPFKIMSGILAKTTNLLRTADCIEVKFEK